MTAQVPTVLCYIDIVSRTCIINSCIPEISTTGAWLIFHMLLFQKQLLVCRSNERTLVDLGIMRKNGERRKLQRSTSKCVLITSTACHIYIFPLHVKICNDLRMSHGWHTKTEISNNCFFLSGLVHSRIFFSIKYHFCWFVYSRHYHCKLTILSVFVKLLNSEGDDDVRRFVILTVMFRFPGNSYRIRTLWFGILAKLLRIRILIVRMFKNPTISVKILRGFGSSEFPKAWNRLGPRQRAEGSSISIITLTLSLKMEYVYALVLSEDYKITENGRIE